MEVLCWRIYDVWVESPSSVEILSSPPLPLPPPFFSHFSSNTVPEREMSKISMGLNGLKKPSLTSRPPPAKRKPVFNNDDSDAEDDQTTVNPTSSFENITTLDSDSARPFSKPLSSKTSVSSSKVKLSGLPAPPKRALNKPPTTENISSTYTSNKHAQQAEELDPSIYDYDGIYDAMKAPPPSSSTNTDNGGDEGAGGKRKYMSALKAAAEVRKRDYIRAQDRKTAREREAEGEEFKDKESFVTGAYKRQQEELRRLEEEEKAKEAEEEAKRKSEGGGMKKFYTNLLERDEERHQAAMKAVEENKGKVMSQPEDEVEKKEKTEADIAKEKGVALNEEGEVVDKRELLKAGLNAGSAAKVQKATVKPGSGAREGETQRERETREFEEQLLGKHGLSSDDDDEDSGQDARASKSRRMEEDLLKGLRSP